MSLLKNKIVVFIVSRYFSYFLQFLNSLIVAFLMGPFYLGIWGFVLLVLQYMNFGNFGIELALNVKLSSGSDKEPGSSDKYVSSAFVLTLLSSVFYLAIALVFVLFDFPLFEKFSFTQYLLPVIGIACLNFFNVLFLNVCRAYSIYGPISFFQTAVQLVQLPVFLFFRDVTLIWGLLIAQLFGHFVSLVYYWKKLPVKIFLHFDLSHKKNVLKKGLSLLVYTLSFYILMLSTRTVIGYWYDVEQMGLFTFASNLASALIVGLSSLEFVLFPKMLNKYSKESDSEQTISVLREVRFLYMGTAFLVVLAGLLGYPLLLLLFKEYVYTTNAFALLVACQIVIASGFGYGALILSRNQERYLVVQGIIALVINLVISYLFKHFLQLTFDVLPVSLIFAFCYYDFMVVKKGRAILGLNTGFLAVFADFLAPGFLVPLVLVVLAGISGYYYLFNCLALLVFLIFNANLFSLLITYIKRFKQRPEIVDIKHD